MRIKHIKVGYINELPPKQKQRILDKYRDINTSDFFDRHDDYDWPIEDMKAEGITVLKGTMACDLYHNYLNFSAVVDFNRIIELETRPEIYGPIKRRIADDGTYQVCPRRERTDFEFKYEPQLDLPNTEGEETVQDVVDILIMKKPMEELWQDLQEAALERCRDWAQRWLTSIREEYEYEESDKAVEETLLANEMEFEIDLEEEKDEKQAKGIRD